MSSDNYEKNRYGHNRLGLVSNDLAEIVISFTSTEKWVLREKYPEIGLYLRDT